MAKKDKKKKDDDQDSKEQDKDKTPELPPTGFFQLFRYASNFDLTLLIVGCLAGLILGAGLPALMVFMGEMTNVFIKYALLNGVAQLVKQNPALQTYFCYTVNNTDRNWFMNELERTLNKSGSDMTIRQVYTRLKMDNETFCDLFNNTMCANSTEYVETFKSDSLGFASYIGYVGLGFLVFSYIMITCSAQSANNQAHRIRLRFFQSIIHQDMTWYDTKTSGDFATKINGDLGKIQDGIGDKVAMFIVSLSTLLCSLGTAFYYGWELTLIVLCAMPILAIAFWIIGMIQAKMSGSESAIYGKAGAVAEEVLSSVRTVFAFDGQKKEIDRYEKNLIPAKKSGIKRNVINSIGMATMWLVIYCCYGLAFWYGVRLIVRSIDRNNTQYEPSTMITVFFCVMMGAFSSGQAAPYMEAFGQARGASALIFDIIKRKSAIDSSSKEGIKLKSLKGEIHFQDVHFNYPSRSEVKILKGLTLNAEPGQTVALVGPSGCGKSTVIQLIQRFYDIDQGQVLIDGKDIRELNIGWVREQIGVVGQEPVLFNCSILENIRLGCPNATLQEVERAAIDANAHDFILRLPQQYNTLVGERGSQLSGGQKQRIAIARALIKNPKILLLDESTSALDLQSESIVQAALDRASIGRTTFIVAHRLSTIKGADKIIVIDDGQVKEIGTHNDLMASRGLYFELVQTQQTDDDDDEKKIEQNNVVEHKNLVQRAFSMESAGDRRLSSVDLGTVALMKEKDESVPTMRLLKLVEPEKWHVTVGTIGAIIMGLSTPAYALIFGDILMSLSKTNKADMQKDVLFYSLMFCLMGVVCGIASFAQLSLFGIVAERLTFRMRKLSFAAMLRQEVAWYDDPKNTTGALCSRLSGDAASIQGAAGSRLSTLAQAASTLVAAVTLALFFSWKLGLVVLVFVPIIIFATYFQVLIMNGMMQNEKDACEEATKIAVEAIGSIKTVASLHQEMKFFENYKESLAQAFKKSRVKPHIRGVTYGIAQSSGNFAYGIALWYGSLLIANGELTYGNLFKTVEAVIFGTSMIGYAVAFSPDYQKGKIAAVQIFKLLDRQPKILVDPMTGEQPKACKGNVQFKDVYFNYPTRPKAKILRGLTLDVQRGQTVALVGSSGCGKSTCIQLLERFYDCDAGEVCLDNRNLINLNIPWLRKQVGIVSQEPVLFGYSIGENIAYGDNSRHVEMAEIIEAAEKANIHDFIKTLPMGYDTPVGDKGTQLSGGQKQRIAIARALVRNPEILLLDEATSALDSESEKVVQAALDEARQGRTCLVIAHRLSTIQNADKIVVINKGKVVEEGAHQELLERRGAYYQLYTVQGGGRMMMMSNGKL